MHEEGLFRISPDKMQFDFCIKQLNEGKQLADLEKLDSFTVASLLKKFCGQLNPRLFSWQHFQTYCQQASDSTVDLSALKVQMLAQLPKSHYELARHIFPFFNELCSFSQTNKMHSNNLAITIGPNFFDMPLTSDSNRTLMMNSTVTSFIQLLIENADFLFN